MLRLSLEYVYMQGIQWWRIYWNGDVHCLRWGSAVFTVDNTLTDSYNFHLPTISCQTIPLYLSPTQESRSYTSQTTTHPLAHFLLEEMYPNDSKSFLVTIKFTLTTNPSSLTTLVTARPSPLVTILLS